MNYINALTPTPQHLRLFVSMGYGVSSLLDLLNFVVERITRNGQYSSPII